MNKLEKIIKSYLEYHACSEFLEKKYGYDERDYTNVFGKNGWYQRHDYKIYEDETQDFAPFGGKWTYEQYKENKETISEWQNRFKAWQTPRHLIDPEPQYQDFWHWVVDAYSISNGCSFEMIEGEGPEEDWQKEIFQRYIEEFGEGEIGKRKILFGAHW